jgi:hypothetical protein
MTECPTRVHVAAVLWIVLLVAACETTPDLAHPKSYAKDGISFQHPGNWLVSEDVTTAGVYTYRYLFVESPGSALVAASIYTPPSDESVEEFAVEFRRRLIQGIDDRALLEASRSSTRSEVGVPVRAVVMGAARDGVEHALAASALGEVVPHRFRAFKVELRSTTIFLVVQAASEDWPLVAPGFDLVLATFEVR